MMKLPIVGVSGITIGANGNRQSSRAGKSLVSEELQSKLGFASIAFADALKRGAMHWFGFDDETMWGPSGARDSDSRIGSAQTHEFLYDPSSNALRCRRCNAVPSQGQQCPVKAPYTARTVLQQLGEAARRLDYNVWVNRVLDDIRMVEEGCEYSKDRGPFKAGKGLKPCGVVVSDVRFPNEIEGLRRKKAFMIRVVRQIEDDVASMNELHDSERALLDMPDEAFDYVLYNKSPEQAKKEIVEIVKHLPVTQLTTGPLVDRRRA